MTVDLYEGKMPVTVIDSLLQLGYLATKKSPGIKPHIQGYLDGQGSVPVLLLSLLSECVCMCVIAGLLDHLSVL